MLPDRLESGSTALADVARTIAVHPRTVQRGLADEGLTFGEILDCVRRERARAYLTGTDLPLAEISDRLGFAEPAVLSRRSAGETHDGPGPLNGTGPSRWVSCRWCR